MQNSLHKVNMRNKIVATTAHLKTTTSIRITTDGLFHPFGDSSSLEFAFNGLSFHHNCIKVSQ